MMKMAPLKLKVAIFFGYNGTRFHGLQKVESNLPTVEAELETALHELGLIPAFNYGSLSKSSWGRGSRTDKGVHACLNTVKCKIFVPERFLKKDAPQAVENQEETKIENVDLDDADKEKLLQEEKAKKKLNFKPRKSKVDWEMLIKELNSRIDKDIRVFAFRLVVKAFDLKQNARSRKYEYILPSSILKCKETAGKSNQELLEYFNAILIRYKGSHSFHNYTWKGDPNAKSSMRYILDLKAEFLDHELIGENAEKEEFIIVYIHGQSFLYNQIRKMIGTVLQVFHLELGECFLDNTFLKNRIELWLAPSQGLLLDRVSL
jgi:tRNA pseudouridine38-40 synthase